MKKILLGVAAAALLSTGAMAQSTVTTTTTGASPQRACGAATTTYVTEKKLHPVTTKERIIVGGTVPSDVELVAVPSDWGSSLTRYRYVYSNDRVMLVDPGSRTVVQEID